jgi:CubicO group peptidase (beta-lactamase class C family)
MRFPRLLCCIPFALAALQAPAAPELPGVAAAMQSMVGAHEIPGAVTLVATGGKIVHLDATGLADVAKGSPMTPDTMFWIASMTKPVTSVAILMLQDDGRLGVNDPVAKYIPEFAALKTPSGKPANLTVAQLLNHTSGLADPRPAATQSVKTLRDYARVCLSEPMQFEPGTSWRYTSSGFNVAGLIVEVVTGRPFEAFLQDRLFTPLGMPDTTFYPNAAQQARLARAYRANPAAGVLTVQKGFGSFGSAIPTPGDTVPMGAGGLFSTAGDYARFGQMLLNGGMLDGRRYLSADGYRALTTVCTGNLPTGYTKTKLNHVLGWGLGAAVVQAPAGGVSAMLSPGSFGHPGAFGTAAWIDPVKGAIYVMMVQRSNMPDNFENPPALAFIRAAAAALANPPH